MKCIVIPKFLRHLLGLFFVMLASQAALSGQILFSHILSSDKSTIELETDGGALVPSYAREIGSSDVIQLFFDDQYSFSQLSSTPTGWDFNESSSGGTASRTYFYAGLDGGNPNELYDFSSKFTLDFVLLGTDPVLSPTTVNMSYAFSGISFPGGIPSIQLEGFSTPIEINGGVRLASSAVAIPEPSTYATTIGFLGILLFAVCLRSRSKS